MSRHCCPGLGNRNIDWDDRSRPSRPAQRLCSEASRWGSYSAQDLLREAAAEARRAEGLSFGRRLFPSNGAPGVVGSSRNAAGAKDFGPHFDFPAASLNNGPTQAPYPGW